MDKIEATAVAEFPWPAKCSDCPLSEVWDETDYGPWMFWCKLLDKSSKDRLAYGTGKLIGCPLKVRLGAKKEADIG